MFKFYYGGRKHFSRPCNVIIWTAYRHPNGEDVAFYFILIWGACSNFIPKPNASTLTTGRLDPWTDTSAPEKKTWRNIVDTQKWDQHWSTHGKWLKGRIYWTREISLVLSDKNYCSQIGRTMSRNSISIDHRHPPHVLSHKHNLWGDRSPDIHTHIVFFSRMD